MTAKLGSTGLLSSILIEFKDEKFTLSQSHEAI